MLKLAFLLSLNALGVLGTSTCPNSTIPTCKKSQMHCILPPQNGDVCPKVDCINKKYKSPLNPKEKCDAFCPIFCRDDYMLCPGPEDSNGCSKGWECIPKVQNCKTICPVYCPEGEKLCQGGIDANGCTLPNFCIEEKVDDCINYCPCPKGLETCPSSEEDGTGCPLPPLCLPIDDYYYDC